MSCLWMCLSLLYAASFPQSSALEKGVSLMCNQTDVEPGGTVTLNCTIKFKVGDRCSVCGYSWNNIHGSLNCTGDSKYKCDWDNQTYVSLTIWNVTKEETYSVSIHTDCGIDNSSIKVQLNLKPVSVGETTKPEEPEGLEESEESKGHEEPSNTLVTIAVLIVFTAMVVFGILCFLLRAERCKNIIKTIKMGNSYGAFTPEKECFTECSTSSESFV